MPFNLKNAPQIFQYHMNKIFKPLSHFCLVSIDDILIFNPNKFTHTLHLHKILDCLKKYLIIILKTKVELYKTKIEFLGLIIDKEKILLQPRIVLKILNLPCKIEDLKDLQRFLGLLNYNRKFIPNLNILVRPLYNKFSKNS